MKHCREGITLQIDSSGPRRRRSHVPPHHFTCEQTTSPGGWSGVSSASPCHACLAATACHPLVRDLAREGLSHTLLTSISTHYSAALCVTVPQAQCESVFAGTQMPWHTWTASSSPCRSRPVCLAVKMQVKLCAVVDAKSASAVPPRLSASQTTSQPD